MKAHESLRGVENLRFRFQMNNRLRLECLAAMSKVFREFGEPITDELLSSVVFALPQELISANDPRFEQATQGEAAEDLADSPERRLALPPDSPRKPAVPPAVPPASPRKPALPPAVPPASPRKPALPPARPGEPPAMPPAAPPPDSARSGDQLNQVASEYMA